MCLLLGFVLYIRFLFMKLDFALNMTYNENKY